MPDQDYSVFAIKYVGSDTAAQEAQDVLDRLRTEDRIGVRQVVAISKGIDGKMVYHPINAISAEQGALGLGLAGLLLGLLTGRPLRWAIFGATVGYATGTLSTHVQVRNAQDLVPALGWGESVLYVTLAHADWDALTSALASQFATGETLVRTIAPGHEELASILPPLIAAPSPPPVPLRKDPSASTLSPAIANTITESTSAADGMTESSDRRPDSTLADFTRIKGIGPVIDQRLREAGIHSFAQLSEMNPMQLAEIAQVPAARIESSEWIKQAKALAAG